MDADEFRREEFAWEQKNDELYSLLAEGFCPVCKEHSVLFFKDGYETVYYCDGCGGRWE